MIFYFIHLGLFVPYPAPHSHRTTPTTATRDNRGKSSSQEEVITERMWNSLPLVILSDFFYQQIILHHFLFLLLQK